MESSKLSSAIVKFIMGVIFLGFPNLIQLMTADLTEKSTGTQLEIASQEALKSMSSLVGSTSYIIGIGMIVSAIIAFHRYSQGEDFESVSTNNKDTGFIKEDKKEEIVKAIKIKNNEIDFDNKELNNLVSMIKNLANELNQNEIVYKNPEWSFLVEKSKSEYIEKVYKNYMSLPKNKKLKNLAETKNQLTIILNGLVKIEDNLEKEVQKMQKANETFLNEKVKSIGEF